MNAMKKMAVGFVFAAACANSFAAQGRWTEGFGQGNLDGDEASDDAAVESEEEGERLRVWVDL